MGAADVKHGETFMTFLGNLEESGETEGGSKDVFTSAWGHCVAWNWKTPVNPEPQRG